MSEILNLWVAELFCLCRGFVGSFISKENEYNEIIDLLDMIGSGLAFCFCGINLGFGLMTRKNVGTVKNHVKGFYPQGLVILACIEISTTHCVLASMLSCSTCAVFQHNKKKKRNIRVQTLQLRP